MNNLDSAICALHPASPAVGTCERCGAFVCAACRDTDTPGICPTCRTRAGQVEFPLRASTLTSSSVWNFASARFKAEWSTLSVATLLYACGVIAWSFVSGRVLEATGLQYDPKGAGFTGPVMVATLVNMMAGAFVGNALLSGVFLVSTEVLDGKKADLGAMGRMGQRVVSVAITGLLASFLFLFLPVMAVGLAGFFLAGALGVAGVLLAGLLAVLVLLYGAPALYLAVIDSTLSKRGPAESIQRALELLQGRWGVAMTTTFTAGLLMVAGVFACCVGVVPAAALGFLMEVTLYRALSSPG